MNTVDNLLLKILKNSSSPVEELINIKDARVLRSLAGSVTNSLFITENQSRLLLKILRENAAKLSDFTEEITQHLVDPLWSKPFRYIEQIKKFYIERNTDNESRLVIEFTYNSDLKKLLTGHNNKIENLTASKEGKIWYAELTEKNIVTLYDLLEPYQFNIDENILDYYKTIKSWDELQIRNQFLISNIENKNFQNTITEDLGLSTPIDKNIIHDRSVRYQYNVEDVKNPGENLVEYLANRPNTKLYVDKKQHSITELFQALTVLRRFPVLIVFDNVINSKYLDNLENLSKSFIESGLNDSVGIYFRLPNDELGKKFNGIIASNQYNKQLDKNLKVAVVSSGKIPKFFLKNTWRPMAVIALDTKMGLRHGKTSVYTNCCDLIIEYADEPAIMDIKKILR